MKTYKFEIECKKNVSFESTQIIKSEDAFKFHGIISMKKNVTKIHKKPELVKTAFINRVFFLKIFSSEFQQLTKKDEKNL